MANQVQFMVSKKQRSALEELARSDVRGEADRARVLDVLGNLDYHKARVASHSRRDNALLLERLYETISG